jgi:hypothetical protein
MKPETIGMIIETKFLNEAKSLTDSKDALAAIKLAQALNAWGIVLAGRLHRQDGGCFAAILPDKSLIGQTALAAHARMGEIGSKSTVWLVRVDNKELRHSILALLRSEAK